MNNPIRTVNADCIVYTVATGVLLPDGSKTRLPYYIGFDGTVFYPIGAGRNNGPVEVRGDGCCEWLGNRQSKIVKTTNSRGEEIDPYTGRVLT